MKHLEFYKEWLEHDGKRVYVNGRACILRVSSFKSIYPYDHNVISVMADPCNKRSKDYLETKHMLGDHWSTDVLESSIELQANILSQARELAYD